MATALVVDDDSTSLRLARYVLQKNNYTVVTAFDGVDALERLAETTFDVVLTDLMMPRMDGLGLLNHLRADERYKTLPVILLTASGYEQDYLHAIAMGASAFLTKPTSSQELIKVVNRLVPPHRLPDTDSWTAAAPVWKNLARELPPAIDMHRPFRE